MATNLVGGPKTSRVPLEVGEREPVFDVLVDEIELVELDLDGAEEQVLLEPVSVPDGGLKCQSRAFKGQK